MDISLSHLSLLIFFGFLLYSAGMIASPSSSQLSRGKYDYRFFYQKRQSKLSSKKQLPQNEYTLINLGIKKITIDTKYSLMPVFTKFISYNMKMKKDLVWNPINDSKQGLIHLHILFLGIVHFALFRINDFAPEHVRYSNSTITNQFCLEIIGCRVRFSFNYLIYPYYPAYMG